MSFGSGSALALALLLGTAPTVMGQAPIRGEFGVEGLGLVAQPGFAGGGIWGAVRPSERLRLGALAAFGERGGAVVRWEVVAHFLLDPARIQGAAIYGGGGIGGESGRGGQAWVVALVGIEGAPGGTSGWVVEAGVGGGVRVAAGWRWRIR